jgi:hypothetical protein
MMFGSFAGGFSSGLFNGASSTMGLYKDYQAIRATDLAWDNAKEIKEAHEADTRDQDIENTVNKLRQDQPVKVDPVAPPATSTPADTSTPAPAPAPASSTTGGPKAPAPGDASALPTGYTPPDYNNSGGTPPSISIPGYAWHDPWGNSPPPTQTPPTQTPPAQTPPTPPPYSVVTTPGAAPSATARVGQAITSLGQYMPGSNAVAPPGGPYGSSPNVAPKYAPYGTNTSDTANNPWGATVPPPTPPPLNAAGVQGQAGSPSGPAVAPPAPSVLQRPSAITNRPVGSTVTSPFTASPASPPAQTSQAQPPSGPGGVAGILSQLNPMGTAHAETLPPAKTEGGPPPAAPPAQPAAPPAPAATPAPAQPSARPSAQPSAQPSALPVGQTGIGAALNAGKPATPPTQTAAAIPANAAPPAAPPVPVAGKPGVTQSESTPQVISYPPSPKPYQSLTTEKRAMVDRVIANVASDGSVTPEQLAGHWQIEGGLAPTAPRGQAGPSGGLYKGQPGEIGPMQILPNTYEFIAKMIDPDHKIDPESTEGSLTLGAAYLKYLATGPQGLGKGSPAVDLAYMRGPGAANLAGDNFAEAQKKYPDAIARLNQVMYSDHPLGGQNFPKGNGQHTPVDPAQAVAVAKQSGPDGLLNYIATTGPTGLGMSDRWAHLQAGLEAYAVATGHLDQLGGISEWVAQQSHQGAISNLLAGYQSLQSGDPTTAGQLFARAHAFFPDGTYAKFGVDKSNQLWSTLISEKTGEPMGQPFQITADKVASQIIAMQHPQTYIQELQKYQKGNAEIDMLKAHGDYYREMPDVRQSAVDAKTALAQGNEQFKLQLQQSNQQHQDEMQQRNFQHQQEMKGVVADKQGVAERNVDNEVNRDYPPGSGPDPQKDPAGATHFANSVEVEKALRYPTQSGGAGQSGQLARDNASKLMSGALTLKQGKDPNGNPGYAMLDKDGKPHGYLSNSMVEQHIKGLTGSHAIPAGGGKSAAIGAGAGTPNAQMMGFVPNMSGRQVPALQQTALG